MAASSALLREGARDRLSVLVVDDDEKLTETLGIALKRRQFDITTVSTCSSARRALEERSFDVVLVDLLLPDGNGIDLLMDKERVADTDFIVITGHGTIPTAIEALRRGAHDYLTKPVDPKVLADELLELRKVHAMKRELRDARDGRPGHDRVGTMIGGSAAMRSVFEQVKSIAAADVSVLIEGESGTGKETLARLIHDSGPRAGGPFVVLRCGAIEEAFVESELFGRERGDAPNAARPPGGFFERALGGTLFVDEIAEMSPSLQRRFLRAIDAGSFHRLGGVEPVRIDVRLVASISSGQTEAVSEGFMRGDLYFRLSKFKIRLPALSEREGDVAPLAEHFLSLLNASYDTHKRWAPGAIDELAQRTWVGNVRELKNAVQRAYFLSGDLVEASNASADAPALAQPLGERPLAAFGPGASIDEVERALILATMEHTRGHKPAAAKMLGISLKTLYNKLHAYRAILP